MFRNEGKVAMRCGGATLFASHRVIPHLGFSDLSTSAVTTCIARSSS